MQRQVSGLVSNIILRLLFEMQCLEAVAVANINLCEMGIFVQNIMPLYIMPVLYFTLYHLGW